jgi:hypothetical protein
VNSDVLLFPPAFVSTVFASSNMKCAPASDGWFGIDGYARLPLNLQKINYTSKHPCLTNKIHSARFEVVVVVSMKIRMLHHVN